MKFIEHKSERYHLTIGPHKPVRRLQAGQKVRVEVPDCDGVGSDGNVLDAGRFFKFDRNTAIANPVVGPFYIEDAKVGDTITVFLHEITIDRTFGRTGISSSQINLPLKMLSFDRGVNSNLSVPEEIVKWQINSKADSARLCLRSSKKKYVEIPVEPFIGCIAVAPSSGEFVSPLDSGEYGGNLDVSGVDVKTRISMPVLVDGACLFLGDIHAAQGDGEYIGGGIEVGGKIVFSVEITKNQETPWPRIENDNFIGCIGTGSNIDQALAVAFSQLVFWLSSEYGFDKWEAMHLLSQVVTANPGNHKTGICRIAKKYIV